MLHSKFTSVESDTVFSGLDANGTVAVVVAGCMKVNVCYGCTEEALDMAVDCGGKVSPAQLHCKAGG